MYIKEPKPPGVILQVLGTVNHTTRIIFFGLDINSKYFYRV